MYGLRHTIDRSRWKARVAAAAIVLMVAVFALVGRASAGAGEQAGATVGACERSGDLLTISFDTEVEVAVAFTVEAEIVARADGVDLDCGGATQQNINTINIDDDAGDSRIELGDSGYGIGGFGPGLTLEGGHAGGSEIEIYIDGGGGADRLEVVNSSGNRTKIGTGGINWNAGRNHTDVDIIVDAVEKIAIYGSGQGVLGTGTDPDTKDPTSIPLELYGQRLTGGLGNDLLVGTPHNDKLNGYKGTDTCVGNGGSDTIKHCEA